MTMNNQASRIASHVKAVVASAQAITAAEAAVGKAKNQALVTYAGIWKDAKVTSANFDSDVKTGLTNGLKASGAFKDDKTIAVTVSRHKVAIIGLSNGFAPEPDENLQTYVERVRDTLKDRGLYQPKNAGGAKPKATETDDKGEAEGETIALNRTSALALLCDGDKADMEMLNTLTRKHMEQLRKLFVTLYPATAQKAA